MGNLPKELVFGGCVCVCFIGRSKAGVPFGALTQQVKLKACNRQHRFQKRRANLVWNAPKGGCALGVQLKSH